MNLDLKIKNPDVRMKHHQLGVKTAIKELNSEWSFQRERETTKTLLLFIGILIIVYYNGSFHPLFTINNQGPLFFTAQVRKKLTWQVATDKKEWLQFFITVMVAMFQKTQGGRVEMGGRHQV